MQWKGMPPQRAVSANTAAAARTMIARVNGSMELSSSATIEDDESSEQDAWVDSPQRLPSSRPIDQRWDRSRGIVFGSTSRNQDSIRYSASGIPFGPPHPQSRQYSQRALPASRPYQQPTTSPKTQATTLSDNPYHTPTPLRIASDNQKVVELAKEKDQWKAKEAEATLRLRKTLEALDDQRKRAQAREDDLEAELRKERASIQQQKREHALALDQQRKDFVQKGEATIPRLERQVASLTRFSNHFKRRTEDLERDVERQDEEHKRDLVAQQTRLEISHSHELAEQTRQGRIRKNERATYDEYRKVYRELDEAVREFNGPILAMDRALSAAIKRQKPPPTHSEGMNKINPLVLRSKGKIFQILDECQQRLAVKHEEEGQSLKSLRYEMQEKYSDFSIAAHQSRTQSRYHRIQQVQTKMETADLLHYVANDLPVRRESRAVQVEMKKLEESIDREHDETVKASLRAQYAELSTTRACLSNLIGLFHHIRSIATLEALQSDSVVEKEVFTASLEAESRIERAGRLWNYAVGQSGFANAESDVSLEDQASTRKEYTRTLRQTHQRLEEFKEEVRKRAWLDQHLGRTQPDLEHKVDAIIQERIANQRIEERKLLQKFGVARMSHSSSFARTASMPPSPKSTRRGRRLEARASSEPPKKSAAMNSNISPAIRKTTAFGPSMASMQRNLSELKSRRSLLSEGAEKVEVVAEITLLRRKLFKLTLPNLRAKRDLARRNNDEALLQRLELEVTSVKAALADAKETEPTTPVARRVPFSGSVVRRFQSSPRVRFTSAGRRKFSSSSRSSSSPDLMSGTASGNPADLDTLDAAMQRTTISPSSTNHWPTMSEANAASSASTYSTRSGSTHVVSAADMHDSGNSSTVRYHDGNVNRVDTTSQLRFRIPDSAYREAALASPNSNAAYWSYRLYKDTSGKSPSVHYCTNSQQAERELQHFVGQLVIGFDMEWDSTANKNSHAKRNASLIQIACEDRICLIHIARFPSDNPDQLVPPTLRLILESTKTIKAGVNIQGDARRMREYLGTEVRAQFELCHLYKVVTFDRADINKTLKGASMAVQVQKVLRLPLKKDDVRVSAWARPLNQEQCDYSASDAYAGYQLFRELEAKRELMNPTPPRPAWAELKEPLVLGDGTMLRAKPKSSPSVTAKATPAQQLDDDDAGEEFYDALETQDGIEDLVVPLQGISISYPSLPTDGAAQPTLSDATEASALTTPQADQESLTSGPTSSASPEQSSVSELDQADSWIATYRTSWRVQPGKPQASVPNLRAHHLWHEQRLETTQVASLLRDPPLSINTVASYVLEAIRHEGLPFKPDRLRDVLGVMPEVVKAGRYRGIVDKLEARKREGGERE